MSSSGQNQSCEFTRVAPDVGITLCSNKRIYWSPKLTKHSLLSSVITRINATLSLSPLSFFPSQSNDIIPILNFIRPTILTITNQPFLLFTSFSMSPLLTAPPQPKLTSSSSKQLYSISLSICLTSFLLLDTSNWPSLLNPTSRVFHAGERGYVSGSNNPCVRVLHRRPGRSRLVVCTLSL